MRRVLTACLFIVSACGDVDLIGDLEFDGLFDGLFEPGPGFFSRMDAATDWVSGTEQCGIKLDGGLWCWSIAPDKKITVHQIAEKSTFKQVVASTAGVCALAMSDDALCWLQQGVDGAPYTTKGPWKTLSMGYDRTCGIRDDGTLWCWGTLGYNTAQTDPTTGDTTFIDYASAPRQLTDGTWLAVASGADDTSGLSFNLNRVGPFCALRNDHSLWCYHYSSEIYFDPEKAPNVLTRFDSPPALKGVVVGADRICGLTNDQSLVCNQLGWWNEPAGKWISLSMHGGTQCGVQDDHSLWCWGILPGTGDLYSSHHTKERKKNWANVQVGPRLVCGTTLDHELLCLALPGFMDFNGRTEATSPVMVDAGTLKN